MAVVLLSVQGDANSATSALNRVGVALGDLSTTSGKAEAAALRLEAAQQRLEVAQQRLATATVTETDKLAQGTSALARHEQALARVQSVMAMMASGSLSLSVGADALARSTGTAAATTDVLTRATESATSATTRRQSALASYLGTQAQVIANEEKLAKTLNEQPGGGKSSGHGGGILGTAGSYLMYGVGYQLAGDVLSQLSQGFQQGLATQRTMAMTGATTGISPATQNALTAYVMGLGGSGTQPFSPDVLAQGLYAIPSAGITNPTAIKAINDQATKFSAFSGSTDTQTAAGALIQTMSAYGVGQGQMASQAGKYQDVITAMVNLGIVQPSEVAPSVTTFGSAAAQYKVPFSVAGGEFAALTYTTRSAQQSAQDENALLRSIAAPNLQQRTAAKLLGVSDLFGTSGMDKMASDPMGYFRELQAATRLNPGLDFGKLFGNQDAVAAVMGLVGPGGSFLGRTGSVINATSQSGTTTAAYARYEQSPAAQFDNSVAAFKTAEQQFAQAATPLATAMLKLATDGIKGFGSPTDYPNGPGSSTNNGISAKQPWVRYFGGQPYVSESGGSVMTPGTSVTVNGVQGYYDLPTSETSGTPVFHPLPGQVPSAQAAAARQRSAAADAAHSSRDDGFAQSPDAWAQLLHDLAQHPATPTLAGSSTYTHPGMPGAASQPATDSALAARQALFDQTYGTGSLARGGAARPPDITAAQRRLDIAIAGNQGRDVAESAFGSYKLAVNTNPLLSGTQRTADILAEGKKLGKYEGDLTAPERAARTVKDFQDTIEVDKLTGNYAGQAKDSAALLAFQTANQKLLKLDPADIQLMAVQNAQAMAAIAPTVNTHPFFQANAGLGGLVAGNQSTAVRLGGGPDLQTQEVRTLRTELQAANNKIASLLTEIAGLLGQHPRQSASRPNPAGGFQSHIS